MNAPQKVRECGHALANRNGGAKCCKAWTNLRGLAAINGYGGAVLVAIVIYSLPK